MQRKAETKEVTQGDLLQVDFWLSRAIVYYRDEGWVTLIWDHLQEKG